MWNLVGFMVMVGVLLTARWALRVWDATPHEGEESLGYTERVYLPISQVADSTRPDMSGQGDTRSK